MLHHNTEIRRLGAFALLVGLAACGKPTSGPLFTAVPQQGEVPEFRPVAMRSIPQPERDQLLLRISGGSRQPDPNDVVNSPGASSKDGTRPSVIIAVPAEATRAARQAARLRAEGRAPRAAVGDEALALNQNELESFQTDGYYNQAEQQIETALLRNGFDVLDRAKFEAKLRDLRDRAADGRNGWRCGSYCDIATAAGTDAALNKLKNDLEKGDISIEDFTRASAEIERQGQVSAPGERRTEDEMIDIAEVIRAAQTGEDQADYLLQISGVSVEPSYDRQFSIAALQPTRDFISQHPGLQMGSGAGRLPSAIPAKWFRAEFNAKLMDIKTGSIVWLGNHTLESWNAEPQGITITIDVERRVANGDDINGQLRAYNERGAQLEQDLRDTRARLEAQYRAAQTAQEFESDEALNAWESRTRSNIATLERQDRELTEALRNHIQNTPPAFNAEWIYDYMVSDPRVDPALSDFATSNDRVAQERLAEHRTNLIRAVTTSLLNTIIVNQ